MAAPKPERIVELLDEVARLLEPKGQKPNLVGLRADIEEGYRWLFGATHSQAQRSGERVRGGSGPGSGGPTASVGLSGGGERTLAGKRVPTLSASTQDYARRKMESAGDRVREATAALRGAATDLSKAFAKIDEDTGHTPSEFFDAIPKQEVPEEIDRKRLAQRQRTERGEVYAEDALPRPVEYETHRFLGKGLLCRQCSETSQHPVHDTPEIQSWRAFMEYTARVHRRPAPVG